MLARLWLTLPLAVRWLLLLSIFVGTCVLSAVLQWGSLPATVLLIAGTLLLALYQHRASDRLMTAVTYETGVIKALGNYALTRLSRDDMLRAIVRYLANSTDASVAVIVMSDPKDSCLTGYMDVNGESLGPHPIERTVAHSIAGHIFSSNQAKNVPDTAKDPDFAPVPSLTIGSLIGVPLRLAGQPIGVIVVGKQQTAGFTQDDVHLLETLARTISVPLYASRPAARDRASTAS
jgi:GAF domain-containing protein